MDDIFRQQIQEDIKCIQDELSANYPDLRKDDYAFHYWILTKLFNIDEEMAEDHVTEYSDKGIDCYVFFEEDKELFIIQNKYYSNSTILTKKYVEEDFLLRPLSVLKNGKYTRSQKLQDIYNQYKNDTDFKIHLHMYVTNNKADENIKKSFPNFKNDDKEIKCYIDAKIFYLNDIADEYWGEFKKDSKKFNYDIWTKNRGTVLKVDSENYDLKNSVDATYIFTPIIQIHDMIQKAERENYGLFEKMLENIWGVKE